MEEQYGWKAVFDAIYDGGFVRTNNSPTSGRIDIAVFPRIGNGAPSSTTEAGAFARASDL